MKIAYITNCFGIQSHTFIRREIEQLNKLDVEVELLGIRAEISDSLSRQERALVANTHYLYPLKLLQCVYLNLYWALLRPQAYWPTLWKAVTNGESRPLPHIKLLYHFFVAPYHAHYIATHGVEHIHAHFLNVSATIAMYASLLTAVPYSITVHSAGTRQAPHIIGIPMKLRYAQFLVMISHYNIEYFDAIFPCKHKSIVVRCGMDLHQYPYKPKTQTIDLPESSPAINVLAVGRMVEKKGFQTLLEATKILVHRGRRVSLEILGAGPLCGQLQEFVNGNDLAHSVQFPGQASSEQVRAKMLAADMVAVPSVTSRSGEMEGIPVVLMEAMALGVPVVSTSHSGIPELVRNGETGMVVEEKNATALADALAYVQDHPAERAQWVERARHLIETEFNVAVVAEQRRDLFVKYSISEAHSQRHGQSGAEHLPHD